LTGVAGGIGVICGAGAGAAEGEGVALAAVDDLDTGAEVEVFFAVGATVLWTGCDEVVVGVKDFCGAGAGFAGVGAHDFCGEAAGFAGESKTENSSVSALQTAKNETLQRRSRKRDVFM
jgi:hypothetical protein